MYPYDAGRNGLDANVPEWAHEGGVDAMIARFHDPATRARIKKELWNGGLGAETPDGITIAEVVNPELEKYMGQRLSEIARSQGTGLARKSPHPHAGVLFMDFLLSDAQSILATRDFIPTNVKVKPLPEGLALKFVDPAVMLDESAKWEKLYAEIITRQSK